MSENSKKVLYISCLIYENKYMLWICVRSTCENFARSVEQCLKQFKRILFNQ